jgi:type II secretory pathway pseudopilin PulG
MHLRGQQGQQGYAMAALLVALAVMSVLMSAVLPAWRHQAQREKEAELIFRGEQYVRAISLWERRHGPGTRPPNVDVLVDQRFLRKKYKDPMTPDGEFQLLFAGVNPPAGAPGGGRGGQPTAPGGSPQPPITFGPTEGAGFLTGAGGRGGGLHGVVSKSRETAIRIYPPPGRQVPGMQSGEGRRYNEWLFVHAGAAAAPGGGPTAPQPGGIGAPDGRGRGGPAGGRGIGPGGRGMPPGGRGFGPGGRGIGPGGRTTGPNRP